MSTSEDLVVTARWDPDAKVWVATSNNIPGLAIEAPAIDELIDKLQIVVPELLEANGLLHRDNDHVDIPWTLLSEQRLTAHG